MKAVTILIVATLMFLFLAGCEKQRLDQQVKELCAKDGGVKVYETVKLTPDLLDEAGRIRIPTKESIKQGDRYFYVSETTYLQKEDPKLTRMNTKIVRLSDGKVLGEVVRYGRGGGDPPGPWHPSSFICPNPTEQPYLETSVFVRGEMQ